MSTLVPIVPSTVVPVTQSVPGTTRALIERDIVYMAYACFLPRINYIIPLITTAWIGVGACSLAWNPTYYIHQAEFWSAHIMLLFPAYIYLLTKRKEFYTFVGVNINKWYRWITLAFYGLFMAYWAYFCWFELYNQREDRWYEQIGNVFMSITWYIFFSVASTVYYYTAVKLLQRSETIKQHIHTLTDSTLSKFEFFRIYDQEFEINRKFGNVWNRIIQLVIFVLIINIPADALAIFVKKAWFVIPGLIMKSLGLLWYLLCICKLNYMEKYVVNYLHKHHILQDDYEEITRYMEVRPLGLNFYGLRITYEALMKVLFFGVNLLVPTLYGLFSNQIITLNS